MSGFEEIDLCCPHCRTTLVKGYLKDIRDPVHIETLRSLGRSDLQALICPTCGHVELQALHPENLMHRDISDQDLGIGSEDRWFDSDL
jgi:hypothetical protein